MSDASMKERLARAVCNEGCNMGCNGKACVTWDRPYPPMSEDQEYQAEIVDAILREMLEPSTTYAAMGKSPIDTAVSELAQGPQMLQDLVPEEIAQIRIWLIQHILDES